MRKYYEMIFKPASPETYDRRLKAEGKTWLIRESRVPGMLTVNYLNNDGEGRCERFAFIPNKGWQQVLNSQIETRQGQMISVDLSTSGIEGFVAQLLEIITQRLGLVTDSSMLLPKEFERTRADTYYMCQSVVINPRAFDEENLRERLDYSECPITLKGLLCMDEPVVFRDRFYEKAALLEWFKDHDRDVFNTPLTEADKKDYSPTRAADKMLDYLMPFHCDEAEAIRKAQAEPGMWLVRPSLNVPGGLEVTYNLDGEIKHACYYFHYVPAQRECQWVEYDVSTPEKIMAAIHEIQKIIDSRAHETVKQLGRPSDFRKIILIKLGLSGENLLLTSLEERFDKDRDEHFVFSKFGEKGMSISFPFRLYENGFGISSEELKAGPGTLVGIKQSVDDASGAAAAAPAFERRPHAMLGTYRRPPHQERELPDTCVGAAVNAGTHQQQVDGEDSAFRAALALSQLSFIEARRRYEQCAELEDEDLQKDFGVRPD